MNKRLFKEDGGIDLKLSLEDVVIDMLVQEVEEGIKMKGILEDEVLEEVLIIIIKDKVGLDKVKVKEDPEGLERDKEMEAVKGMEMVINQGNESIHLIRME